MKHVTVLILLFFAFDAYGLYVRVNKDRFEVRKDEAWLPLERFIGFNLGVTPPGHFPGEVLLRREDYLIRFKRLEELGVNVIRVYSLHHPDFYDTLIEWNQNSSHKFYVFHGTSFPEYQFEAINGTNAFDPNITNYFKNFIKNTVSAVYGGGEIEYRKNQGVTPVFGNYKSNIAKYLLGWVIGGEISPANIYRTNLENPNIKGYKGAHISTNSNASAFDSWIAEMMDYVAVCSDEYGEGAPISHTNWVTTDGIKNELEPKYPDSVEDWQEIDQTDFISDSWEPGVFYNTHVYPYYPYLVSTVIDKEVDPYQTYLSRLKEHYKDKPFIVTEVGLSTSIGVASYDDFLGRNHGGVGEKKYPELIESVLKYLIKDLKIQGVLLFQLQDEWFKKTWNTENVGTYNRHRWRNTLSAEQNFGIFKVSSESPIKKEKYKGNRYFTDLEVSNNMEYITIKLRPLFAQGNIVIGLNTLLESSREVINLEFYKFFNLPMNHLLIIDLLKNKIRFKQLGTHNTFLRNYGVWLNQEDNLELDRSIRDIMNPDQGLWYDYKLLVKAPGYYNFNNTKVSYTHKAYTLEFKEKTGVNDNLALFSRDNGLYIINIPYQAVGIIDPSEREIQVLSGQGNTYNIYSIENSRPVKLELSYFLGTTEIKDSIVDIEFNWKKEEWIINFCETPKEGFADVKKIIRNLNNYNKTTKYTDEELTRCIVSQIEKKKWSFLYYVTTVCFIFLASLFFYSSVVKWVGMFTLYCYTFQIPKQGTSHKLKLTNLFLLVVFFLAWFFGAHASRIEVTQLSILYFILLVWESFVLLCVMCFIGYGKWDISKKRYINQELMPDEHVFVVVCHNSSDVIENTLRSLVEKVEPTTIYVADNGSSEAESELTNSICERVSIDYFESKNLGLNQSKFIHYGRLKTGNKSIAQYATLVNLPRKIKLVTCIDDDTRLHESWSFEKVAGYFRTEEDAVLAYPLKVHDPEYEIEYFQYIEYLNAGFVKLFQSEIRTTLFNSGAFGTYRKEILAKALREHNANFHGDDLQICLNIHNMREKTQDPFEDKNKILSYKVNTASDIIATTIVPKCWIHTRSISSKLSINRCTCNNPDLFGQRVKGWFLSEHRFLFKYLWTVFNLKGFVWRSLWIRIIVLYDAIFLLNQYFAIVYAILFIRYAGLWLVEGLIIGMAFNVFVLLVFDTFFLKPNKLDVPIEVITLQPIIYKLFIVTIYKYLAILYNLIVYTPTHRNGNKIGERVKGYGLKDEIENMYNTQLILDLSSEELEYDDSGTCDLDSFASSGNKNMTLKKIPKPKREVMSGNVDEIIDESKKSFDIKSRSAGNKKVIRLNRATNSGGSGSISRERIIYPNDLDLSKIDIESLEEISFI